QIGKPPAVKRFPFSGNLRASMSRLNVPRLMKIHDALAQLEIQPVARNGKLGDVTIRLAFRKLNHLHLRRYQAATVIKSAKPSPIGRLSHTKLLFSKLIADECNVRFGSETDISLRPAIVGFTPQSGH